MQTKKQVSIMILATLPDNGIKSLGSKSLLKFKNTSLIEYQLDMIRSAMKNIEYEILFVCGFDCQRVCKVLSSNKKLNIKFIKQTDVDNLNFCGAFLHGLKFTKYNNVISINYGSLFKKNVIQNLMANISHNSITIASNHSLNSNIKLGCSLNNNDIHIFYNLGQHKYLDINFWSEQIIKYIKSNIQFENIKNRFMFELINLLSNDFKFKYNIVQPRDCIFIDSLKTLTHSKRIFNDDKTTNKKTKY